MASTLRDLLRSLARTRDTELPSTQNFPPLNVDHVTRDLGLIEKAEKNGSFEIPSGLGDLEDTVEGEIKAFIENRARSSGEAYRSQLELYNARIRNETNSLGQAAEINAAGESAIADFKVQIQNHLDALYNLKQEVQESEREYSSFRKNHKIDRPAFINTPRQIFLKYIVLLILVLSESFLNGFFFAKGSEAGIIGGILQALVLSLLNVGSALLFSRYGLPLIRHDRKGVKLIGVLFIPLYIVWITALNLFIGHFRDVFAFNAGEVSISSIFSRLGNAPFKFNDASSLILFLLGLGINILSIIDASKLSDPFPGYGPIGERRRRAIDDYTAEKETRIDDLTERRDIAIEEMKSIIEIIRSAVFEFNRAMDGRLFLYENYKKYLDHLKDCYTRLIQKYREQNIKARKTAPPERFIKKPNTPEVLLSEMGIALPRIEGNVDSRGINQMEYFIKEINSQFTLAAEKLHSISDIADSAE